MRETRDCAVSDLQHKSYIFMLTLMIKLFLSVIVMAMHQIFLNVTKITHEHYWAYPEKYIRLVQMWVSRSYII